MTGFNGAKPTLAAIGAERGSLPADYLPIPGQAIAISHGATFHPAACSRGVEVDLHLALSARQQ